MDFLERIKAASVQLFGSKPSLESLMTQINDAYISPCLHNLTHKQLETHACILRTVDTDALTPKPQAISIHYADYIFIVLDKFPTEIFI